MSCYECSPEKGAIKRLLRIIYNLVILRQRGAWSAARRPGPIAGLEVVHAPTGNPAYPVVREGDGWRRASVDPALAAALPYGWEWRMMDPVMGEVEIPHEEVEILVKWAE